MATQITLRLEDTVGEQLKLIAVLNNRTVSEELRAVVESYVENVRNDPEAQQRLEESIDKMKALLAARAATSTGS